MAKVQSLLPKALRRLFKTNDFNTYHKLSCQSNTLVVPKRRREPDFMDFKQNVPKNVGRTAIENILEQWEMKQTELSCRDRKRMESEDYMVMSFPLSKP